MIDDGNPIWSNRKNLLCGIYNKVGIAISKSNSHEFIACIVFSGKIEMIQSILDRFPFEIKWPEDAYSLKKTYSLILDPPNMRLLVHLKF